MAITQHPTALTLVFTGIAPTATTTPADVSLSSPETSAQFTDVPKSAVQLAIPGAVATQIATPSGGQADSNMKTLARGTAWEDQDITTLARIMLPSKGAMQEADLSGSIALEVYDLTSDTPDTSIASSSPPDNSVKDALQVDAYWNTDDIGYNFRHTHAAVANTLTGGRVYRFEYTFDTDNDGLVYVVSEIAIQGLYST